MKQTKLYNRNYYINFVNDLFDNVDIRVTPAQYIHIINNIDGIESENIARWTDDILQSITDLFREGYIDIYKFSQLLLANRELIDLQQKNDYKDIYLETEDYEYIIVDDDYIEYKLSNFIKETKSKLSESIASAYDENDNEDLMESELLDITELFNLIVEIFEGKSL